MFADLLRSKLSGIVDVTEEQLRALETHYHLLLKWNAVLNLTRIDSLEEAVELHYCESLFLAAHLSPGRLNIVDIGSGAGFPGIPVAIYRPESGLTLIESRRRKAVFLREATRLLSNVRVLAIRAEEVQEQFDCAISRAVSYADLIPVLKRIAGSADLLTGVQAPPESIGFAWEKPIQLPWGRQRFLRKGVVSE